MNFRIFKNNKVNYFDHKSLLIRNNKFYDDDQFIEINYRAIKHSLEILKSFVINSNYALEIRECIMWSLNNLYEIISFPCGKKFQSYKRIEK